MSYKKESHVSNATKVITLEVVYTECKTCKGSGKDFFGRPCWVCFGSGTIRSYGKEQFKDQSETKEESKMTHWALINLVTDMRRAQKEYFRTRSKEALLKAKTLEAEVDKEISEWENECKTAVEELMLF